MALLLQFTPYLYDVMRNAVHLEALERGEVGAAYAVDPLHHQHAPRGELGVRLGDLHQRVALEVAPEGEDVAQLLRSRQLVRCSKAPSQSAFDPVWGETCT
jgi:hypothetical protein